MNQVGRRQTEEVAYSFGPFRLLPDRQLLLKGDVPVKLGGRAFELLKLLVIRKGEILTKLELTPAVTA